MSTSSEDIVPINQIRDHRLEREHIHFALLEEAKQGWDDVESGRLLSVVEVRARHGKSVSS